jgi:acetylornithine deacetylase
MSDRTASDLALCKTLLRDLVAFPSVTGLSNLPIVAYCEAHLARHGIVGERVVDETGERANLFATVGPSGGGGVVLSGHLDVVPADGAGWRTPPFQLDERAGRLHGRGAVDMKGFLAAVLAKAPTLAARAGDLKKPLHIAFTYDEEIGSFGGKRLYEYLSALPWKPAVTIVGEPTGLRPIGGHKGGFELIAEVRGRPGHSSRPDVGVNAIYYAARLIAHLEAKAAELASKPREGSLFDPPYTTISVGKIAGGEARNVIPAACRFDWEIRPIPGDDGNAILDEIRAYARDVLEREMRRRDPDAGIDIRAEAIYPPLGAEANSPAEALIRRLWTDEKPAVVSFGTDGGYFQLAGIPTIVFGPGAMAQMHAIDEYIEIEELDRCLRFLDRLIEWACEG